MSLTSERGARRMAAVFVLASVLAWSAGAAAGTTRDAEYGYQVEYPDAWRVQRQDQQGGRIAIGLSPDEAVAVAVTSIDAARPLTSDEVHAAFEGNLLTTILSGGQRSSLRPYVLNGLAGVYGVYRGPYDGTGGRIDATLHAFYGAFGSKGYIVWWIVPSHLVAARGGEAERVMRSFLVPSLLATLPPKTGSTPDTAACDSVVGAWKWFTGSTVVLDPGGTIGGNPGNVWTCEDAETRTFVLRWGSRFVDTLVLSADGQRLEGKNQHGSRVSGQRLSTPDARPPAGGTATSKPVPAPAVVPPPPAPVVQKLPVPVRMVATTTVNLRSGPGTGHAVVGRLRKGDEVTVVARADADWRQVVTGNGLTAFVSGRYLDLPASGGSDVPQAATSSAAAGDGLPNLYGGDRDGYTIRYGAGWSFRTPRPGIVQFLLAEGPPGETPTVGVEGLSHAGDGGPYRTLADAVDGLWSQLYSTADVTGVPVDRGREIPGTQGPSTAHELVVDYSLAGRRFRQWMVVAVRPADSGFLVWYYTAPTDAYEAGRRAVEAVLASWRIL
ncbi:MAG: SH3 domain-containing protein [Thalassobaculum sp.]|uniref:SH3 domain-containing protein n=1 Tax=Thalassobaculum sp. TaxID=2022740 RepID=UPI0032EBF7E9